MPRLLTLLLLGSLLLPVASSAQIDETFADGDFSAAPSWTGETDRWTVVPFRDDFALRSDGPAASDTLHLATPSEVSFGAWSFTLAYDAGLSNFNKVRVYLLADQADLEGDVTGYHLELGTNDRDVALYRSDPERAAGRVELATSAEDVLPAEADTVGVVASRTAAGIWSVEVDGAVVLSYAEDTPVVTTNSYFGVWVKHSSTRNQSYYFDDVHVEGETSIPDTTPPAIDAVTYSDGLPGFVIAFTEDIDFATSALSDFSFSGDATPLEVVSTSGSDTTDTVWLVMPDGLSSGTYEVSVSEIEDAAGNVLADTTVSVVVDVDDTPPSIIAAEAVAPDSVRVSFSEFVTVETACAASSYALSDGIGVPADVLCPPLGGGRPGVETATLVLSEELESGTTYTLVAANLADVSGNVHEEAKASFVYVGEGPTPAPGDMVINEFNYRAFGSDAEYVELLNLTDESFDLSRFALADATRDPVTLSDVPRLLQPHSYAILVRDSAAFADQFPGVAFVEVPNWPALNNGGDEITLIHHEGATVDSLSYTSAWGTPDTAVERVDPNGPSSVTANWAASTDPRGGTPGERNSVYAVDTTPPDLLSAAPNEAADTLRATFSEPLDPTTVTSDDFTLGGASISISGLELNDQTVLLALSTALATGDYTLSVTDVADFTGNTLDRDEVAFSVFRGALALPRDVVINEVFFDTPTRGEPEEYVEMLNVSEKIFDLSDFAFADEEGEAVPLLEVSRPLLPGGYVVLVRDGEAFTNAFPEVAYVEPSDWPALNNSGDVPTLLFGETVIDAVPYEGGWGETNVALERIDPSGPSDHGVNWAPSTDPRGGTPGERNSVYAPDEAPPQLVFVEQLADTVVVATFDEPLDSTTVVPEAFVADGTPPASAVLIDDGNAARLVFRTAVDAENLSAEGLADLSGNVLASATAPIAGAALADDIVINELLFAPATDSVQGRPPAPEYVELLNTSDRLLSLRGLVLTSSAGADTFVVTTRPAALAPRGYAVIFADPDPTGDPAKESSLAAAFPDVEFAALHVSLLPIARSTLDLSNSGETVRVHRADGTTLDAIPYDPDWHSPDLEETRGVALERIDPAGDPADGANWSSATVPAGGTPGQPNSIFTDPGAPPSEAGLRVQPSPFSPDGDGYEDFVTIVYTLREAPATVRVRIYNQTGRLVRTLTPATLGGRAGRITWDGRDDDGRRLRMGIYVVVLDAVAAQAGHTEAYKAPVVVARKL